MVQENASDSSAGMSESTVLVVDDDDILCQFIGTILEDEGFNVVTANSGEQALSFFDEFVFDVVFTDVQMDGMDGIELLSRITAIDYTVKTIVMTAYSGYDTVKNALKNGAHDFLEKPLTDPKHIASVAHNARRYALLERDNKDLLDRLKRSHTKLQLANRQLLALNERLEELALTDSLTMLKNRRFIDNAYEQEFARYLRYKQPFTIMLIDVDRFKDFNDLHGHSTGDRALQAVSQSLLDCTRDADSVGRYGGEEFFIILSNTEPKNGKVVADRILNSIRGIRLDSKGMKAQLTVSIGLMGLDGNDYKGDATELLDTTDQALYLAKSNGRDRVYSEKDITLDNENRLDAHNNWRKCA